MSETVIRRVIPSDRAVLRRVRLRALLTDPASFGSTYKREAAFPDQVWTGRATRGSAGDGMATLLALRDGEPVGIVTAVRDEAQSHLFHVAGMWIAPGARREGVGRTLLSEIEAWIASCGGSSVRLNLTVWDCGAPSVPMVYVPCSAPALFGAANDARQNPGAPAAITSKSNVARSPTPLVELETK